MHTPVWTGECEKRADARSGNGPRRIFTTQLQSSSDLVPAYNLQPPGCALAAHILELSIFVTIPFYRADGVDGPQETESSSQAQFC